MHPLLALSYADRRTLVNTVRALYREPWRALLWLGWLALTLGIGWMRTRPGKPLPLETSQMAVQDAWTCVVVLALGALLAFGPRGAAGFFASRVEALALVRAPVAPAWTVTYLQARSALTLVAQTLARFTYLFLLVFPVRTTPLGLLRELLLFATALVAITTLRLPRALARGAARLACVAAGVVLCVAALEPIARSLLYGPVNSPASRALADRMPAWHPGGILTGTANGDLLPIAWMVLLAILASLCFIAVARDAFPELYALSIAHLEHRERVAARRLARGSFGRAAKGAPRRIASERVVLRGALALVWLDAVTWSRSVSRGTTTLIAFASFAAGAGVATVTNASDSVAATVTLFGALPQMYIAYASTASVRLGTDARRPLFWLGAATPGARLRAWCFAPLWRDAGFLGILALGYGLVAHGSAIALTLFVGGFAIALLTRAVGAAIFALLPNPLDQRGPASLVRLLIATALVLPTAVVAAVVGVVSRMPVAGALTALACAAVQGLLLVRFAGSRLAGRIDRLIVG